MSVITVHFCITPNGNLYQYQQLEAVGLVGSVSGQRRLGVQDVKGPTCFVATEHKQLLFAFEANGLARSVIAYSVWRRLSFFLPQRLST